MDGKKIGCTTSGISALETERQPGKWPPAVQSYGHPQKHRTANLHKKVKIHGYFLFDIPSGKLT